MGLNNYNSGGVQWAVDNSEFSYVKLNELVKNQRYPLFGFYVTKDNGFGEGAVLITADFNINIPNRYVDLLRKMAQDPQVVEEINDGRGWFSYDTFISDRYHREGYRLTFGADTK